MEKKKIPQKYMSVILYLYNSVTRYPYLKYITKNPAAYFRMTIKIPHIYVDSSDPNILTL